MSSDLATVRDERLAAQLLTGPPAGTVDAVLDRLLAVQAQDPRAARLAVRARSTGLTAADVDRALTQERSAVVGWLQRGTLHLVRSDDYRWLHALTAPTQRAGNARRLSQEGVTPAQAETGVAVVRRVLSDGPATRAVLREHLQRAGVPVAGQALVHVLALASLRGSVLRGPVVDGEQAFAQVDDWLGPPPPAPDHDAALAELARRYLTGHGPAGERDLARWAGLPLRDARRGLRQTAHLLQDRTDGLAALRSASRAAGLPLPRLLGGFEPLLLGWADRSWVLGEAQRVVTVNGTFLPFALADGRVVATWGLRGGRVELRPFGTLDLGAGQALTAEADAVRRFLDVT